MTSRRILAIDPGPDESAYVLLDEGKPTGFGKVPNRQILADLEDISHEPGMTPTLVIEQVAAMGMAVGAEVFETVFWSGRFAQVYDELHWDRLKRHEVKMHLCGNMRAKDANIRQALLDRFGPGKELAIGTKKKPGPLYGIAGDCWSALAIACTWHDTRCLEPIAQEPTQ